MLDMNLDSRKTRYCPQGAEEPPDGLIPCRCDPQLDEKRRALLTEVEQFKAERNTVSKEIRQD